MVRAPISGPRSQQTFTVPWNPRQMATLRSAAALGALLACTWSLSACGGSDSSALPVADEPGLAGGATDANESDASDGDGGEGPSGSRNVRAPEFVLTGSVDEPTGWILDPANCASPDESGPPFFDHFVPGDWIRRGSGYGGAGGVSGSGDHSYERPDGMRVNLEVDTDSYLGTDPLDADGDPWETWDNDIVEYTDSGERTTRIAYTQLDPVEVDGETFDLYLLDQAQSDLVFASEYKLRVVFADVPTGGPAGQDRRPESATVTISWDADDGDLPEVEARELLSTFRLATCAQEGLTDLYETLTGSEF